MAETPRVTVNLKPGDIERIEELAKLAAPTLEDIRRRPSGGDLAGDREPRKPLPVAPQAGAMALELALPEL